MRRIKYAGIVLGAALLLAASSVQASALTPVSPSQGAVGTQVTLYSSNLTPAGNSITFGSTVLSNIASNGTTLIFSVPAISLGTYNVSAANASGTSNALPFIVTAAPATTVSAAATGSLQAVYTYNTQQCDSIDIPDTPARAFRDAQGNVNLIASHYVSRRAVGSSLNTTTHQCPAIYTSHNDTTQADWRYHEWLMAPYTLDGTNVYSIVHNEWYGSLTGQRCDAGADWVNAFTLAVSHDGGATFAQPQDYLIRYPATSWRSSFPCVSATPTVYGDFNGTNIISKDGYYYRIFSYRSETESANAGQWQECLMRTSDVSNASSWEVWNGSGYTQSKTASCQPLDKLGEVWSITYNTYLQEYIAVENTFAVPHVFSFTTSPDLIHWSAPTMISGLDYYTHELAYPSLLDPEDTSQNFENTGQTPYLYFTRFNNGGSLNRDLLRVQITLSLSSGP
jgi:hypothetical protein